MTVCPGALLALAALFAALPAWADEPAPAAVDFAAVQRLAAAHELEEALAASETLMRTAGADRAVRRQHADLLAWTGQLDRALAEYATLAHESPDDVNLLLAVALAHKWQGDLMRAEDELTALVSRAPGDREVAEQLRLLRADPALPLARARAAVRNAPADPAALRTLVDLCVETDHAWEAETALERARELAPDDAALAALRAEFQERRRRQIEARIPERRTALAAAPDDVALRVGLAEDLVAVGRLREGADEYAAVTRRHPERRDLRLQEARVRTWAGDYRRALATYGRLTAEDPTDDTARVERARILAWDGQLAAAADELSGLEGRERVAATARGILGDVYRWDGEPRRAARLYHEALDQGLHGEAGAAAEAFLASQESFTTVGPQAEFFSDSQDFTARRYGAQLERQTGFATRLQTRIQHVDYRQHGDDLSAERAALALTHDWLDLRGLVEVGVGGYSSGHVLPAATAQLELHHRPEETLGVAYDRYDLIDDVTTLRAARGNVLQGNRARAWLSEPLPLGLRLATTGAVSAITDGNRAVSAGVTLGRRMLRRPRLELRADARYYALADHTARYWSPGRYLTSGLTVQIEQPLAWGMRLVGEGRGGYATEDGNAVPEMSYGAGLAIALTGGWDVHLGWHAGESARSGGYSSDVATFDLRHRLGTAR